MPTKVMKYEIKNPLNLDWRTFNSILNEIQENSWRVSNKVIQQLWAFNNFSKEYSHRTGHLIDLKKEPIHGNNGQIYTSLIGDIYNEISPLMDKSFSAQKDALIRLIYKHWERVAEKISNGEISVPSYKRSLPIEINIKQMIDGNKKPLIKVKNNKYSIGIKLISKKYATNLQLPSTIIELNLVTNEKIKRDILNQLITQEYKLSGSKLQYIKSKKKWFLLLTYGYSNFNKTHSKENTETIMGIDLGIHYPVFMAFNNTSAFYSIEGGEIAAFRKKIEARRLSMLRQSKYCGKGRNGHGRATLLKPTEILKNKVSNFRNTINHRYSAYVIKIAQKHKVSLIQMENLSRISSGFKKSTFLGNWTYYDLQKKIEYKANEVGIKVTKIKPQYTSMRCSKCGVISPDNRDWKNNNKNFKCKTCGYKSLADYNAAKNIATLNIEKIIDLNLKKKL